jgi:putative transposase
MTFITQRREQFGVEPVLRVLGIPASTYYDWVARRRQPSARQHDDQLLLARIRAVHERSGGTYGAPRVHAQLRRDGIRVGRKRIERLMRTAGLQGAFLRKRWRAASTRQDPRATPAPDLVNRLFTAPAPNRLWVADISRIPTGEGPLWLASIRDAFSRRIVGWKVADRATTDLVLGALEYALFSRDVERDQLIHHADRGCQYTAIRLTQRLTDAGISPSMGSVGDSFDNALAENFFSILKIERVYRRAYRTREEAELDLFAYIDGWYNPHRIQRELGWRSPDEYEAHYYATHTDPTAVSEPVS